jgi:hypothetical protein
LQFRVGGLAHTKFFFVERFAADGKSDLLRTEESLATYSHELRGYANEPSGAVLLEIYQAFQHLFITEFMLVPSCPG